MKIINRYKYLLALPLVSLFFFSCTENFEELNTPDDEIVATEVDASLLGQTFATAARTSTFAGTSWDVGGFQTGKNLFADLYANYYATTQTAFPSDRYSEVGDWINGGGWNNFYSNFAPAQKFVEDFTRNNNMPVENAIAKVLKVQGYQKMTDEFGPIIYSHFGNNKTSVPYDSQEDIYNAFFQELDSAVNVLSQHQGETATFGSNDIIFQGSVDNWLRYANSMRLRCAMRIKHANPQLSKSEAEKAANAPGGFMTENAHNATVLCNQNSVHPFTIMTNWGEFRMSADAESILEGMNNGDVDPRIGDLYGPADEGPFAAPETFSLWGTEYTDVDVDGDGSKWEGLQNGWPKELIDQGLWNGIHSDVAERYTPAGRPGPNIRVMSAGEVYFLRAEAALEGYGMNIGAKEAYEQGIRTSFLLRADVDASVVDSYINATTMPRDPNDSLEAVVKIPVSWDYVDNNAQYTNKKEAHIEQIITQKWIEMYPEGFEAWAEKRRTGYPRFVNRRASENETVDETEVMKRLTFVFDEYTNNEKATTAAEDLLQGPADDNSVPVWWDQKGNTSKLNGPPVNQ